MQTQYISLEALRFAITRPLIVVISQEKPRPGSLHIIHRLGAEEIMQQNFWRKRTEQKEKEIQREFWNTWLEAEMREQERVDGIVAGVGIIIFLLFAAALFNMFV